MPRRDPRPPRAELLPVLANSLEELLEALGVFAYGRAPAGSFFNYVIVGSARRAHGCRRAGARQPWGDTGGAGAPRAAEHPRGITRSSGAGGQPGPAGGAWR